jgi:hypothetical protein
MALAGPASASAAVCTGLSGSGTGTPPPVVTGCNDTANTGGTGTFAGLASPGTITWGTGGTNTFKFKFKILPASKDKCPKDANDASQQQTEATIKGKVTGHTGLGSSVSGAVKATVCVDITNNDSLSLLNGTTFKF